MFRATSTAPPLLCTASILSCFLTLPPVLKTMMKMMMVVVDASHLILVGVGKVGDQSFPTPVSNVEQGGHEYLEPGGHQVKKKKK